MTKIMLVEDDKSLREIYSIRLVAEGYNIVSASDGEEALAMAVRERPELIISDVMMPKISGFDMLDIIRSTPETKNIKIIMMTALSSEDQRRRGESLGADMYLVKSQVGIEDVINAVHQILGDRPASSANARGNLVTLAAAMPGGDTSATATPTSATQPAPVAPAAPQSTASMPQTPTTAPQSATLVSTPATPTPVSANTIAPPTAPQSPLITSVPEVSPAPHLSPNPTSVVASTPITHNPNSIPGITPALAPTTPTPVASAQPAVPKSAAASERVLRPLPADPNATDTPSMEERMAEALGQSSATSTTPSTNPPSTPDASASK